MLGYDISLFHGYSHFSRATSLDMVGIYSNDIIHIKGGLYQMLVRSVD